MNPTDFMLAFLSYHRASASATVRVSCVALFTGVLALLFAACGVDPTPVVTSTPQTAAAAPTKQPETPTPAATATSTPAPTNTPSPTAIPRPEGPLVSLPEDEGSHFTPIEWWYFNGFVEDEAGDAYSYHFVTFQSPEVLLGTPHLLHASLSDHERGVHHSGERGMFATLDPSAPSVDSYVEGWSMSGNGEEYELQFDLGGTALDLRAVSRREAVLHDSTGLVNLGEAGDTYYYSRTRLEMDGWLEDAAGRRPVAGTGWMDHQWGDISRRDVGWDWVNLQLDDGSDLMLAVVWRPPDRERVAAYATFIATEGEVIHVPSSGVELEATGAWVSRETGIEYPMGWLVRIPPLRIALELTPVLKHAEFAAGIVLPVSYWEGAVTASGERGGVAVSGRGFVELVGYDPDQASANIPVP